MTRRDRTPTQQRNAWLLGMLCGAVALVAFYALLGDGSTALDGELLSAASTPAISRPCCSTQST